MRKGDSTRQEILRTAEALFCSKGYDATSVQDILDVIHGSKGGFYHHFVSKDAVLQTLCAKRAEAAAEHAEQALADLPDGMERLNAAMQLAMPVRAEETTFMGMLIPLLDRQESIAVRVCFQDELARVFGPLLAREIGRAEEKSLVYPVTDGAADAVMLLLNDCWYRLALQLLCDAKRNVRTEPAALLDILSGPRRCVEVLLDAPYGSVDIAPLASWDTFAGEIYAAVRPLTK